MSEQIILNIAGVGEISAPMMCRGSVGISCGNGIGLRPQIIIASVCKRMETPIAVISGARRGALRRRL